MQEPDYNRAKRAAARLLREKHVLRPPVSPRALAEESGLTVRYVEFEPASQNICGFIDFELDRITVNAAHSINRQTFTIAHELGHALLHRDLYTRSPGSYQILLRHPISKELDPREKEANAFAANLLVPRDMLHLYGKYADDDELATLFGVSKEVIGYRRG